MNWQTMVPIYESDFGIDILFNNNRNILLGFRKPDDEPVLSLVLFADVSPEGAPANYRRSFVKQVVLPPTFLWRLSRLRDAEPLLAPSEDFVFRLGEERRTLTVTVQVSGDEKLDVDLDEPNTSRLLAAADLFGAFDPQSALVAGHDGTLSHKSATSRGGRALVSANRPLMEAIAAEVHASGYDPEELSVAGLYGGELDFFTEEEVTNLPESIRQALLAMLEDDDPEHREVQQRVLGALAQQIEEVRTADSLQHGYAVGFTKLTPSIQTFLTVLHEAQSVDLALSIAVAVGLLPAHLLVDACTGEYQPDSEEEFSTRYNLSILLDYLMLSRG